MPGELGLLSSDFQINQKTVTPGGAATQIFGRDPSRWAVVFSSASSGQTCWVSPLSSVSNSSGLQLASNNATVTFNFRDLGGLIGGEWWGFAAVGANITAIEILYRPAGVLVTDEDDLQDYADRTERGIA